MSLNIFFAESSHYQYFYRCIFTFLSVLQSANRKKNIYSITSFKFSAQGLYMYCCKILQPIVFRWPSLNSPTQIRAYIHILNIPSPREMPNTWTIFCPSINASISWPGTFFFFFEVCMTRPFVLLKWDNRSLGRARKVSLLEMIEDLHNASLSSIQ